ncbi:VC0807 family protein [Streptomyces sp. Wh19]|uniref:VC0807 family protein n=1 Tax=Streptomyces sp. Wh19 TaxID=3076629 RepID=UPI002958C442|nr:VC0807 family protein [Streptomyces sp. Wh19]MDV9199881.1 VC0807 family protein [Streptomyces sp. Wh19]
MTSPAATVTAPVADAPAAIAPHTPRNALLDSLMPLLVDVGVPLASYYALKAAGLGTFAALAWSSVLPAVRTVWGVARKRRLNGLAALIVTVNVVSLLTSLVVGDPRLMLAKDSGVSSIIGLVILVTALKGQPMMTAGVRPWLVKGDAAKDAAWQRLAAGSAAFRRAEIRFSAVWGAALLGECVLRAVGAYTLPVETMVWLGTVAMVATLVFAFLLSGRVGAVPMERMIAEEAGAGKTADTAR